MNNNLLRRRLIFGVVFGFLVIIVIIFSTDVRKVTNHLHDFQWRLFPIVIVLTLFNYFLRGIKFHYYLGRFGTKKINLKGSFQLFVAGFPLAVTPGKVGEALKGVWIHNRTGIPVPTGVSIVLAERISDGLAVLILSIFGVISYPQYWPIFLLIFAVLTGIILLFQFHSFARKLFEFADRFKLLARVSHILRDFYDGSQLLFRPVPTFIAIGLGTISWLGEGVGFFLILVGLGHTATIETLSMAVFILAFSTVIGAVSTLPGGLGAAEISISGMAVFLLGSTPDIAAAATLLIRFATLWFGVAIGLITWIFSLDLLGIKPHPTGPIGDQK